MSEEVDVPAGRYALVHPERSIVEFFVVDKPQDGKWAGRTFVNQQASDDKYPVRGARRDEVLARIAKDPRAAMLRYGHELGRCGNCGRTLTDEVSRAMGIGPDCASQLGIERISEAEALEANTLRAAAEAAPRIEEIAGEIAQERTERKAQSSDKQNVPYGVGNWRARKRYAEEARSDERKRKADGPCSQKTVLPGETWEDIFGGGA